MNIGNPRHKEFDHPESLQQFRGKTLAVIGCGKLGGALVRSLVRTLFTEPDRVLACDVSQAALEPLSRECGVQTTADSGSAVSNADFVILATKPQGIEAALREMLPALQQKKSKPILISVAAGVSLGKIREVLADNARLVRAMPNVGCLIGCGMTGVFSESAEVGQMACALFKSVGFAIPLAKEEDLDAVTGLSASGPAFVITFIEALAEGGVKMGLSREEALLLASHTVAGAAALVLESGRSPAQLRELVATPGGTTLAGLEVLDRGALRQTVIAAVEASTLRAGELLVK